MNSVFYNVLFAHPEHSGYIAGTGAGIVSIVGQAVQRHVYLYEAQDGLLPPVLVDMQVSLPNGRYLFRGLNPNTRYLIIATDYKREYEPVAYDWVIPATDLTPQQQLELWQSWQ